MMTAASLPRLFGEERFRRFVREEGIEPLLAGGVLLGLSGGADSVLLLLLLSRLAKEQGFPLAALHVRSEEHTSELQSR